MRYTGLLAALLIAGCGSTDSILHDNNEHLLEIIFGTQVAPDITPPGPGAGEYDSERPSLENQALAKAVKVYLNSGDSRRRYGDEAVATLAHYFANHGRDYEIPMEQLFMDVPEALALYDAQVEHVKAKARELELGEYEFTSASALATSISKEQSTNWYLAVAAYKYWVHGTIRIFEDERGRRRHRLDISYHIWDAYDWDPGTHVPINTPLGRISVDQDKLGQFHRQGLAREYISRGRFSRTFDF